jgi:RimJ/RimL family protein N-acetyltransferase
MALLIPKNFELKNSFEVTIRSYRAGDEAAAQIFTRLVAKESQNTLKYEGMPDISIEKLTALFTEYADHPVNLIIGVFLGEEVIANLRFMQRRSDHPWIKHIGAFGMGVKQQYWGQGIGSRVLQAMESHARTTEILRIEAEVRASNDSGIHLYQKNGFKIEGRREKAAFIDGKFEDEFYIAKCL